jgi:hypothetical protein
MGEIRLKYLSTHTKLCVGDVYGKIQTKTENLQNIEKDVMTMLTL